MNPEPAGVPGSDGAGSRARFLLTTGPAGVRLEVAGELDIATADRFAVALERLDDRTPVVVDLSGVRFADTSGLAPLIEAVRRFRDSPASFTITDYGPAARRVLDALGVRCHPTVDVAAWDNAARRSTRHADAP